MRKARSPRASFESFPKRIVNRLGYVARVLGVRPSALLEWNDPGDFASRLQFDERVLAETESEMAGVGRHG